MISNSGHDENGKYSGGKSGDQTGGEWSIIPWYNRPWNVVLRHPKKSVRKEIAFLAERAARNNLIGYDQNQRHTFWQHLKASNYDPAQITVPCESDCSAGVLAICKAVGYRLDYSELMDINQDGYTGNERAILKQAGFQVLTVSKYLTSDKYLLRGDVLLYEGHHTAINLTDGALSGGSTGGSENETTEGSGYMFNPKTVKEGTSGTSVLLLQEILKARGFKGADGKEIVLDRECGTNTVYAINSFQEDRRKQGAELGTNGKNDSICGAKMWKDLIAI